jgi:hypothetical protein
MQEEFRIKLLDALNESNSIDFKNLLNIADAFQIASGQGYAIGSTKALLDFLKQGNEIKIMNFNGSQSEQLINSPHQLALILRNIDSCIDLRNDIDFKNYFKTEKI